MKLKVRIGGRWVDLNEDISKQISDLERQIGDTQDYIDGAFKDGIIQEVEAKKIEAYLNSLEIAKIDHDRECDEILQNPGLIEPHRTNLQTAKEEYHNRYVALTDKIREVVDSGVATEDDAAEVNRLFEDFNNSVAILRIAIERAKANFTIRYPDQKREDLVAKLDETRTFVMDAFDVGIIYDAVYTKIQELLFELNIQKTIYDDRYSEIYNNPSLIAEKKNNLSTVKESYDTDYTNLVDSIQNAIEDRQITPEERQGVSDNFRLFRNRIFLLSSVLDDALLYLLEGVTSVNAQQLIKNSVFKDGKHGGWMLWDEAWEVDTTRLFEGDNTAHVVVTDGGNKGVYTNYMKVSAGKKYTFSVYVLTGNKDNIEGDYVAEIRWYDSSDTYLSSNEMSLIPDSDGSWERKITTVEAPENARYARVRFIMRGNGEGWFAKPMFHEGVIALPHQEYSLLANEWAFGDTLELDGAHIRTASITWDKGRGGSLELGGVDNGNGILRVLNEEGDVVAQLDAEIKGFDYLRVVNLDSDNVIQKYVGSNEVFVNFGTGSDEDGDGSAENPFKTLQYAIDSLDYFLEENVTIRVLSGPNGEKYTSYENVRIAGFFGVGWLTIDLGGTVEGSGVGEPGNIIDGNIEILGCATRVSINNGVIFYREGGESGYPIYGTNSSLVHVRGMRINGRNIAEAGIYIAHGSRGHLYANEIDDCTTYCIFTQWACQVYAVGNRGTSVYGVAAHGGCIIHIANDYIPVGTTSAVRTTAASKVLYTESAPPPNPDYVQPSPGTAPPPTKSTTESWNNTYSASWRTGSGWRDTDSVGANRRVYQGQWSGGGHHRGLWFFGNTPSSKLTGKDIERLSLEVTRYSGGGSQGAVNATFRWHTYTSKPSGTPALFSGASGTGINTTDSFVVSFKQGEKKTINLPASFRDAFKRGVAKGIAIYISGNSPYMIFTEKAKLTAVYKG